MYMHDLPEWYVDLYCERVAPGLFQEPLNVLTNGAFIFAGWKILTFPTDGSPRARFSRRLGVLIVLIGLASTLFHLTAHRAAGLADSVAILMFVVLFTGGFSRLVLRCPWAIVGMWLSSIPLALWGFGAISRSIGIPGGGYLGFVAVTFLLALQCGGTVRRHFLGTIALFVVSFVARAFDEVLCPYIGFGTHFIWHLLNALVLYRCAQLFLDDATRTIVEPEHRRSSVAATE